MKFKLGAALLGAAVAVGCLTLLTNARKPVNTILDTTAAPVVKTGYTTTNGQGAQPVDFEKAAAAAVPAVVHIKMSTIYNPSLVHFVLYGPDGSFLSSSDTPDFGGQ